MICRVRDKTFPNQEHGLNLIIERALNFFNSFEPLFGSAEKPF